MKTQNTFGYLVVAAGTAAATLSLQYSDSIDASPLPSNNYEIPTSKSYYGITYESPQFEGISLTVSTDDTEFPTSIPQYKRRAKARIRINPPQRMAPPAFNDGPME